MKRFDQTSRWSTKWRQFEQQYQRNEIYGGIVYPLQRRCLHVCYTCTLGQAQKKLRSVLRSKFHKTEKESDLPEDDDHEYKHDDDDDDDGPKRGRGRGKGRGKSRGKGRGKAGNDKSLKTSEPKEEEKAAASSSRPSSTDANKQDEQDASFEVLEKKAEEARRKAEEDVLEAQQSQVIPDEEEEPPKEPKKVATPKKRLRKTACKASPKKKPKTPQRKTPKRKVKTPKSKRGADQVEVEVEDDQAPPALTPKTKKRRMMQKYQDSPPTKTNNFQGNKGQHGTTWCNANHLFYKKTFLEWRAYCLLLFALSYIRVTHTSYYYARSLQDENVAELGRWWMHLRYIELPDDWEQKK